MRKNILRYLIHEKILRRVAIDANQVAMSVCGDNVTIFVMLVPKKNWLEPRIAVPAVAERNMKERMIK